MRFLSALLLSVLLPTLALPQTKPILERKAELEFGDQLERIITHKFLAGENRLLLVGKKTVRALDVAGAKFSESRPLEVPEFSEEKPRLFSPDGRRMIVFGNYGSRGKKEEIRPPSIWDLQTGKQVAVLDKASKPVREAFWSKNGKTLVTSSDRSAAYGVDDTSVEVSFWDGETFAYKSSLPSGKISWSHLTDDGEKCFYSVGASRNLWILDKYVASTGAPINVWDVGAGKIEQTIAPRGAAAEMKIRAVDVSPGDKFLALVAQPPKSGEAERRLSVWEIDRSNSPRYEIRQKYELRPTPKISEHGVVFSPDTKYFTLDAGKTLQIYEAATGEKRFELTHDDQSSHWLSDNKILLFDYGRRLEAVEVATGRKLYEQKLISLWSSYTNDFGTDVIEPVDTTTIVVHPGSNLFLTYSNQYVKVFDSLTGELVQTLISPPMDYTKKKPRPSDKRLVSKAGWSSDGKALYVIGADGKSVALWGLPGN
jgi:WD40 repeat protein